MILSSKTEQGPVRKNNEDYYLCEELAHDVYLLIVCDGMGGANAGDIASRITAELILNRVKKFFSIGMNDNTIKNLLVSSVETANVGVFSEGQKDPSMNGMGSTVVLALVIDNNVYICSVGDSRLYIVNDNNISQITEDHSIVQLMLKKGEITPEEIDLHPQKNIITRAIGVERTVKVDYLQESVSNNCTLVLCTDGLSNYVTNDRIFEICKSQDKSLISDLLVDEALKNNSNDNITVVSLTINGCNN